MVREINNATAAGINRLTGTDHVQRQQGIFKRWKVKVGRSFNRFGAWLKKVFTFHRGIRSRSVKTVRKEMLTIHDVQKRFLYGNLNVLSSKLERTKETLLRLTGMDSFPPIPQNELTEIADRAMAKIKNALSNERIPADMAERVVDATVINGLIELHELPRMVLNQRYQNNEFMNMIRENLQRLVSSKDSGNYAADVFFNIQKATNKLFKDMLSSFVRDYNSGDKVSLSLNAQVARELINNIQSLLNESMREIGGMRVLIQPEHIEAFEAVKVLHQILGNYQAKIDTLCEHLAKGKDIKGDLEELKDMLRVEDFKEKAINAFEKAVVRDEADKKILTRVIEGVKNDNLNLDDLLAMGKIVSKYSSGTVPRMFQYAFNMLALKD